MKTLSYLPDTPDMSGWKQRHRYAVNTQRSPVSGAIAAWVDYAQRHNQRFASPIGQDYILGDAWARWGFALRELLNGELDGLDAGTLDTILCDNLQEQGWDTDLEKRFDNE